MAKRCPLLCPYPAHQFAEVFSDYLCGKIASIWGALDNQAVASPPPVVHGRLFSGVPVPFTHSDLVSEDLDRTTIEKNVFQNMRSRPDPNRSTF